MDDKKVINFLARPELKDRLNEYRHENRIPTISEAARKLIEEGMDKLSPIDKKFDMQARFVHTRARFMSNWVLASYENYPIIKKEFHKHNADLRKRIYEHENVPAIVCGSGGSLDYALPHLAKFKGIIICGPTQLHTLYEHGIDPQYCVLYDSSWNQLANCYPKEFDYSSTILVTNPTMDPRLIKAWKGRQYYWLPRSDTGEDLLKADDAKPRTVQEWLRDVKPNPNELMDKYIRGELDVFYRYTLPRVYRYNRDLGGAIRLNLLNFGSTGNQAVLVASTLGCKPIGLCGLDYGARVGGFTRFDQIRYDRKKKRNYHANREVCVYKSDKEGGEQWGWEKNKTAQRLGRDLVTTEEMVNYMLGLIRLSAMHGMQIFELSKKDRWGCLQAFPKVEVGEYIEKQGEGFEDLYLSNNERFDRALKYWVDHGQGPLPKPDWYDNPQLLKDHEKELRELRES